MGEVQIHLRDVLRLKEEAIHQLYIIARANSVEALLTEHASKKKTTKEKVRRNSRRMSMKKEPQSGVPAETDEHAEAGDVEVIVVNADEHKESAPTVEMTPPAPLELGGMFCDAPFCGDT